MWFFLIGQPFCLDFQGWSGLRALDLNGLIKHSLNLPCVYVVYLNASYSVITQFHLDVIGYEALSAQQELSTFLRTKKNYTQEIPFKCHFIIISS